MKKLDLNKYTPNTYYSFEYAKKDDFALVLVDTIESSCVTSHLFFRTDEGTAVVDFEYGELKNRGHLIYSSIIKQALQSDFRRCIVKLFTAIQIRIRKGA